MLLRILIGVAVAGLALFAFLEWETRSFMHPSREDAVEEVEFFTGYSLPASAEMIFARRSRPSPMLGDYSSCALFVLNPPDFANLAAQIPATEAPSMDRWCPDDDFDTIAKLLSAYDFELHSYQKVEPDEWAIVKIDHGRRAILFEMTMM